MTDTLKFAKRIPKGPGNLSRTVGISFVDIPEIDPGLSVNIVDTAVGSFSDLESRGNSFSFTGESGAVSVYRNQPTRGYGSLSDPYPISSIIVKLEQKAVTVPVRIKSITEDPTGSWIPVLSRGIFYRVLKMEDGPSSWLSSAGYLPGQYLLAAYTTELDHRLQSSNFSWRGSGVSGSGPLWSARKDITVSPNSNSIILQNNLLAVGGIVSSTGLELLTEGGDSSTAPNSGVLNSLTAEVYQSSFSGITTGRIRSSDPIASKTITYSSLESSYLFNNLYNTIAGSGSPIDPRNTVIRLSGSVYASIEGYYTFQVTHVGKIRIFHWSILVVDRWYGGTTRVTSGIPQTQYTAYLHKGWHDLSIDWAPDNFSNGNPGVFGLSFTTSAVGSQATSKSQVSGINLTTGEVTLKNNYLGGSTTDPLQIQASFSAVNNTLPFKGYFDSLGLWHTLDLNPSAGRFYDRGLSPTSDWVNSSCWVWLVPSLVCALTDSSGNPYSTGVRNWISSVSYIKSTIQWGIINGNNTVTSGTSPIQFGTSSYFGAETLGVTPYSASGTSQGFLNGGLKDPRGDYKSAFVLGHLDVSNGFPNRNSIKFYDIRVRGGGISHEVDPNTLTSGGARERALTHWDISSWEGNQTSSAGIALVQIPEGILTGESGPQWSPEEIEVLVRQSMPAGIKPVIKYV